MASIAERNVFIVDDVAFIHPEHGFAIGHELEKRKVKKNYYLETRADVLCRNREVFAYWRRLGLEYMFLGLEAIDEEGLKAHRKRSSTGVNLQALEIARAIGVTVAINLIAEPDWDERRFAIVREWTLSVPEVVHLTVATPYPGTETWFTEARKLTTLDYRQFDIQHAVLPTRPAALLRRAGQDPKRPESQTPGASGTQGRQCHRGPLAAARTDEFLKDVI